MDNNLLKPKMYVSGKIAGDDNYEKKFTDAKAALAAKYPDYSIETPVDLAEELKLFFQKDQITYKHYLFHDLRSVILTCNAIAMLPDWESSPGARAENAVAKAIGLKIIYLTNEELKQWKLSS